MPLIRMYSLLTPIKKTLFSLIYICICKDGYFKIIFASYLSSKAFAQVREKSWKTSPAFVPEEEALTTTEGEYPQLWLCISSTLLKLLTDSACSQSDDLPCCACITRTSATFANDDKSLFHQRWRSERPDKLHPSPSGFCSEQQSSAERLKPKLIIVD